MEYAPQELAIIRAAEVRAEKHSVKSGLPIRPVPVKLGDKLHIVFQVVNMEGFIYHLGAAEAFSYSEDQYEGFARRQKETFPRGAIYRK